MQCHYDTNSKPNCIFSLKHAVSLGMKPIHRIYTLLIASFCSFLQIYTQCTTQSASQCSCKNPQETQCDLLPDITASWYAILFHQTSLGNGPIEYSQSGNGPNDGRLRLTLSTPNIGHGSLTIRGIDSLGYRWFVCGTDTFSILDPNSVQAFSCPNGAQARQIIFQRIYRKNGALMSYYDRIAGTMTYHPTHGHNHVDDWGIYTLRLEDPNDPNPLNWPIIGQGAKLGFCLMDYGSCSYFNHHCKDDNTIYNQGNTMFNSMFPNYGLGGVNNNQPYVCSQIQQGISSGWTDIYGSEVDGMWINIPPGTCNGTYWIVAETDPRNVFLEEDETNNWTAVPVSLQLQSQPGDFSGFAIYPDRPPVICEFDTITLTAVAGFQYLWNTGDTTRSISVNQPGPYTCRVTNYCGTAWTDTIQVQVRNTPAPPQTLPVQPVCPGNSVSLQAIGSNIQWFNPNNQWIGNGNQLQSPALNQNSFFTARTFSWISDTFYTGIPTVQLADGDFFTNEQGLLFDVYSPVILHALSIFANGSGNRAIRIFDNSGLMMKDTVLFLSDGLNRVELNFPLSPGAQYLIRLNQNSNCFYQFQNVQYPFTLPGTLSIRNSTTGSQAYYGFFNWEIITLPSACPSLPDTVQIQIHPSVQIQFQIPNIIPSGTTSLNLVALPPGGIFSGPGVNGNLLDVSALIPGQPVYIHYLYTSPEGCNFQDSIAVQTEITGFSETELEQIQIYPNPAGQLIYLSGPNAGNCQLLITDQTGRTRLSQNLDLSQKQPAPVSLQGIPPGVHVLQLQASGFFYRKSLVILPN